MPREQSKVTRVSSLSGRNACFAIVIPVLVTLFYFVCASANEISARQSLGTLLSARQNELVTEWLQETGARTSAAPNPGVSDELGSYVSFEDLDVAETGEADMFGRGRGRAEQEIYVARLEEKLTVAKKAIDGATNDVAVMQESRSSLERELNRLVLMKARLHRLEAVGSRYVNGGESVSTEKLFDEFASHDPRWVLSVSSGISSIQKARIEIESVVHGLGDALGELESGTMVANSGRQWDDLLEKLSPDSAADSSLRSGVKSIRTGLGVRGLSAREGGNEIGRLLEHLGHANVTDVLRMVRAEALRHRRAHSVLGSGHEMSLLVNYQEGEDASNSQDDVSDAIREAIEAYRGMISDALELEQRLEVMLAKPLSGDPGLGFDMSALVAGLSTGALLAIAMVGGGGIGGIARAWLTEKGLQDTFASLSLGFVGGFVAFFSKSLVVPEIVHGTTVNVFALTTVGLVAGVLSGETYRLVLGAIERAVHERVVYATVERTTVDERLSQLADDDIEAMRRLFLERIRRMDSAFYREIRDDIERVDDSRLMRALLHCCAVPGRHGLDSVRSILRSRVDA